jgi:hypothetical protein
MKISCVIGYGSFELLFIPFGLCKTPTTFCTLINDVFRIFLDKSMIVYLYDIIMFSENMEDHKRHLAEALSI